MSKQIDLMYSFADICVALGKIDMEDIIYFSKKVTLEECDAITLQELCEDLRALKKADVKFTEVFKASYVQGKDYQSGNARDNVIFIHNNDVAMDKPEINTPEVRNLVINLMFKYNFKSDFVRRRENSDKLIYDSFSPCFQIRRISVSDRGEALKVKTAYTGPAIKNAEEKIYEETARLSKYSWAYDKLFFKTKSEETPLYEIKDLDCIPIAGAYGVGAKGRGEVHVDLEVCILFN